MLTRVQDWNNASLEKILQYLVFLLKTKNNKLKTL